MAKRTAPAPRRRGSKRTAARVRWRLAPGCQVRRERFGLLFYSLAGPRLLFAESGDLLPAELLRSGSDLEEALRGRSAAERAGVARLMTRLVAAGVLHEQPVR